MKKIFYLTLLIAIFTSFCLAQSATKQIEYQKLVAKREKFDPTRDPNLDLQNAVLQAQKETKRIILDIGGEWCVWCIRMDVYLLQNKGLAKLQSKNFVWLKINMSDENENKEFLSKYPEVQGYPHLYVLENDGTFLHSQNTAELEQGKSYNLKKFTAFLKEWSPIKK